MNLFEAVKQNVTTRQAAEMYGIRVNRHGMAVCPFHNDRNPSMKVDKRFHCFACQADGDAVDFVSRLFELSSKEAAMKLADDFGISYDLKRKPSIKLKIREPTPERKLKHEEDRFYKVLVDYFHHLKAWRLQYAPKHPEDEWHPLFVEALQKESYIEYLLAIVEMPRKAGSTIAAIEVDGTGIMRGQKIDSNAIVSAYTKKNAISKLLNDAIKSEASGNNGIYYVDKNKAMQLSSAIGVQFPGGFKIVDGYVHSIRDSGSPVNTKLENATKTQQFKRWFGDWENHPKTASKVVNSDGTPKVVYHGTNADFWTFSLANRGKNGEKLGVGYYFVDNKSSAERYGDRVVEAYLDIKKPASAEVMEISRKDWEKFLDFAIEHRDEYIEGEWKGNEINKEYELIYFDYGSNDAELIKSFLNGIAAGNKDVTEAYLEMLKDSTGYDGIAYNTDNTDYYVAFTPKQIKSATDNIGTFDKDNKDIRYSKQLDTDTSSKITQADVEQLRSIGRKSIFEFTSEDIQKSEKWAKKFYSEPGTKSPFFRAWFGDWRENDTGTYKAVKASGSSYSGAGRAHNTDMGRDISWGSSLTRETQNHAVKSKIAVSALGDIQSVVENSIYLDTNISEKSSNTKMQNTAFMHIYQKATAAKIKNADNAIYKSPTSRSQAKFSVNGNDYEMTAEEFETYVSGTGDFAYKITTALTSNHQWNELNTEQKLYTLEKTYEFSRAYWKKKIKPEYTPQIKWIDELCGTKADFAAYARVIVNKSKEK